jgi:hypothetical protein
MRSAEETFREIFRGNLFGLVSRLVRQSHSQFLFFLSRSEPPLLAFPAPSLAMSKEGIEKRECVRVVEVESLQCSCLLYRIEKR